MTGDDRPPGRQGGARALVFTVLGEFVLPAGGDAWTSTLVSACSAMGVGEKNARQAIARIGEQGIIEPQRHGRVTRWELTERGRVLLESGAKRIYEFGVDTVGWDGEWLVAHCPVPESQRALRHQLRKELAFEGFGELAASLVVSPHPDREPALRRILGQLGLLDDSVILRSRSGSEDADADLVRRAWDLDELAASYGAFTAAYADRAPDGSEACFRATVELVHDWRRFPFIDPELPTQLLPTPWAGSTAARMFHERRNAWRPGAAAWFDQLA